MKQSLGPRTLIMPAPVWVVGTYDADGKPNIMTAAWAGICCSKPPAVYVALREATYTYRAIMERKAFTVSLPSSAQATIADFAGMATGRKIDKFAAAGLTAAKSESVDAPLVEEFALNLECRLIESVKVGLHTLFIGEIVDVQCEEDCLNDEGRPSIEKLRPLIFGVTKPEYYAVGDLIGPAFEIGKSLMKPSSDED
ncbi:flavin reductase family protein [Candidatus Bipolaricaulota bacterium]|nr:flavin reductase family protein [Candidatus Bipolaricaulota bacterium]